MSSAATEQGAAAAAAAAAPPASATNNADAKKKQQQQQQQEAEDRGNGVWVRLKPEFLIKAGTVQRIAIQSAATSSTAATAIAAAAATAAASTEKADGGEGDQQQQTVKIGGGGMFKGSERANPTAGAAATQRPTFEGEKNFLNGAAIAKSKAVTKNKNEYITVAQQLWAELDKAVKAKKETAAAAAASCAAEGTKKDGGDEKPVDAAVGDKKGNAEGLPDSKLPAAAGRRGRDGAAAEEAAAEDTTTANSDDKVAADDAGHSEKTAAVVPAPGASAAAPAAAATEKSTASVARLHLSDMARLRAMDDEPAEAKRNRLFRNKLILAPLTTVGNMAFRRVCKHYGADVTVGEMAVSRNINDLSKSEHALLRKHESEKIFGIQVASAKGGDAAITAALLEKLEYEYDYLDLNTGCPVQAFCDQGMGFGLYERKNRLREVVQSLVNFQSRPVLVKCRIGADEHSPTLHKVVGEYASWGASAVTIHGRSKKQRYSRMANYDYIFNIKNIIEPQGLPCIGNGDIYCYQDIVDRKQYGLTSYYIGRGALIKPWVFTEIKEERMWDISSRERFDMLKMFCKFGIDHWGADDKGIATTRRFLLEEMSFLCRYVPVGLLDQERHPRMNDRPPPFIGRDDLETLMGSESVTDWIKLSEMLLGPAGDKFSFTPKHKSNSYTITDTQADSAGKQVEDVVEG